MFVTKAVWGWSFQSISKLLQCMPVPTFGDFRGYFRFRYQFGTGRYRAHPGTVWLVYDNNDSTAVVDENDLSLLPPSHVRCTIIMTQPLLWMLLRHAYSMEGMPHIPKDIVFNILVRLPKQPILRFRCLSKHWNPLLSDHFMKSRSRRMILLPTRPLHTIDYTNDGTINGIVLVFKDDMILYNPFTQAFKIVSNQSLHPSHALAMLMDFVTAQPLMI
ncbi:putative F-box domain-containing protein [Helianthus anomalus]